MVEHTKYQVKNADMVLVLGTSLMVWSGYRLAKLANDSGAHIGIINIGETRADPLADIKIEGACGAVLPFILGGRK